MICYKDMSFCNRDCKNKKCRRNKIHIPEQTALLVCYFNFDGCKEYNKK